ncbi:MAG TPA: DUF445 domain-containing protein [Methylomirabilota bacterium]|jgi:uncharacterized membrane-anchored protein YjiN (DUF445 family)|nr:DUF445 domain-containing protein [Methylomirabilota bacterium]
MRRQRRLALSVLLGAGVLAVVAFPVRSTWWGGWVLAIAEAGIVGGLADWFAVTAIFRRPLGLPIPHTALIPANWEAMAERVGVMVGGRVLTKQYVMDEIARVDLADLIARGAERLSREDLDAATRAVADWAVDQLTPSAASELMARVRAMLAEQPATPTLAAALRIARQNGWDRRVVQGLVNVLADAMERSEFRATVAEVIEDLMSRYRGRLGVYPRLWIGLAELIGVLDRDRLVEALHSGLRQVAKDPDHPLRTRASEVVEELEERLTRDAALAARVEAAKRELLNTPAVATLLDDLAGSLRRTLLLDLRAERSEAVAWIAERLERARQALVTDAVLRVEIAGWLRTRAAELVERYHGRIAQFIENGVRALGPEGAVRLIEEHAGDDLQYIRVNGTVVGGLAGGAIYGIHLLLHVL